MYFWEGVGVGVGQNPNIIGHVGYRLGWQKLSVTIIHLEKTRCISMQGWSGDPCECKGLCQRR